MSHALPQKAPNDIGIMKLDDLKCQISKKLHAQMIFNNFNVN